MKVYLQVMQGGGTHAHTVGGCVTAVKVQSKDKGVDFCLVSVQGHYCQSTVNRALTCNLYNNG